MKLYYSKGACSLAVRITIHEIGLDCEYEAVDLKTKKTEKDGDYLKINPKGAVPALVLDSKDVLTENCVIQQYLADQFNATQLLPPIEDFKRYRVLEWLNFISTDIHKTFGPLFNPDMPQEIKNTFFIPLVKKKLTFAESYLGNNAFLLGDAFTLADSYLFVMLFWLGKFKLNIQEWPKLADYFERLKKRPSIEKSLAEEKLA